MHVDATLNAKNIAHYSLLNVNEAADRYRFMLAIAPVPAYN
jgi:hypothetical protein